MQFVDVSAVAKAKCAMFTIHLQCEMLNYAIISAFARVYGKAHCFAVHFNLKYHVAAHASYNGKKHEVKIWHLFW